MIFFHMTLEAFFLVYNPTSKGNKNHQKYTYLCSPFKFIISNATNKTLSFHVFFYVPLQIYMYTPRKIDLKLYNNLYFMNYPFISQFSKCIHNNTKHNV